MATIMADKPNSMHSMDQKSLPKQPHGEIVNEFESRLDDIGNLIDDGLLTNEIICRILKQLIAMSGHSQVQSLWTALQPLLHRDFMFTGQKVEPEANFQPISTALSRDIRTHLTRTRNVSRYHRVQSAHLTNEDEVLRVNKLPPITTGRSDGVIARATTNKDRGVKIHFPTIRRVPNSYETTRKQHGMKPRLHDERVGQRRKLLGDQKREEIREKVDKLYVWFEGWSNPEKAIFFGRILPKLEMKQLYFLSTYLSVRQHCDFITKLPKNLSLIILSHLSAKDLVHASMVSKKWRKISLAGSLWEEKCDDIRSQMATPSVKSSASVMSRHHYDVYRSNHIRQRNWSRARCDHVHLEGHEGKVLSVAFNNKIVVSGGADATVRVWNIRKATALQVLAGHSKGVWCVAIFTNVLVISGSYDHTVKIWNIRDGTCLRTLYGHTGAVWALACKQHLAATGSHDKSIKVWDMSHCKLLHTFKGHSKPVFAVDLSDDLSTLFSGSADHSVRIWGVRSGKVLRVIWSSNSAPIMSLCYAGGYLAYAADNLLNIWDIKNSKIVRTYKGHKCRVEAIKISVKERDGETLMSLLSAGKDGKVKHWRFGKQNPVKTVVAHKDCQINCIAFDKKRLVTALYDNSICICDFSVTEEVEKYLQL